MSLNTKRSEMDNQKNIPYFLTQRKNIISTDASCSAADRGLPLSMDQFANETAENRDETFQVIR